MIVPTNAEKMRESLVKMTNRALKAEFENEKLKALLSEAREDIRDQVENSYPWRHKYPRDQRRYEVDMDIVKRIDAALENKDER